MNSFACALGSGSDLLVDWSSKTGRSYTVLTAVVGLALTISTAVAWQKDASKTGLVQRALVFVYFSWIVLVGIHLL